MTEQILLQQNLMKVIEGIRYNGCHTSWSATFWEFSMQGLCPSMRPADERGCYSLPCLLVFFSFQSYWLGKEKRMQKDESVQRQDVLFIILLPTRSPLAWALSVAFPLATFLLYSVQSPFLTSPFCMFSPSLPPSLHSRIEDFVVGLTSIATL